MPSLSSLPDTNFAEYKKLLNEDSSQDEESSIPTPIPTSQTSKLLSIFLLSSLFGAVVFMSTRLWDGYDKEHQQKFVYTDCSDTPEMARAAHCTYEPMMRSWIPPECYFNDFQDEYDLFHDRLWFLDHALSIPANISRLESGDETLAYTRYWHDEHCTYNFRKLAVAVEKRYPAVPQVLLNIEHSHHCAKMIALRIQNEYNETFIRNNQSVTRSGLGFQGCIPLPWA
jgi:hypothetical protein